MNHKLFTFPNILTLLNLLCGTLATVFALAYDGIQMAFIMIVIGAALDFLDGFAARLLNSFSPVGKELDSLADLITFGMAPAAILFCLYENVGGVGEWGYLVLVLVAFSALRLAKFNVDERQSDRFIGLPTPACALLVGSAGYLIDDGLFTVAPVWTVITAFVLGMLLISPIPMFALKFKSFGFKGNELRYTFSMVSLVGLLIGGIQAVPFIITVYILISAVGYVFGKNL